jgi:hypothetical protein
LNWYCGSWSEQLFARLGLLMLVHARQHDDEILFDR